MPIDPKDAERVLRNLTNTTLNEMRRELQTDLQGFAQTVAARPVSLVAPPPVDVRTTVTEQQIAHNNTVAPEKSTPELPSPIMVLTCVFNGGKTDVGFPGAFVLPPS